MLEVNSSSTINACNVFGPFGLVSRTTGLSVQVGGQDIHNATGQKTTCYQFDPNGNVAVRSDSGGNLLGVSVTRAFGTVNDSATFTDPFAYEGQYGYFLDRETGLYYCKHRYYDPAHGHWLNRDPIGQRGGMNTYAYCSGNPIGRVDPGGLQEGGSEGEDEDDLAGARELKEESDARGREATESAAAEAESEAEEAAEVWKDKCAGAYEDPFGIETPRSVERGVQDDIDESIREALRPGGFIGPRVPRLASQSVRRAYVEEKAAIGPPTRTTSHWWHIIKTPGQMAEAMSPAILNQCSHLVTDFGTR